MDPTQFAAEMRSIVTCVASRHLDEATERAIALESSLRREPSVPAAQIGWARYYAFRSAYESGNHERAYELLLSLDDRRHDIGDVNRAWMYSVACELAAQLGDSEAIDAWGERCYQLRRKLGHVGCALRCALLVCRLLKAADALTDHPRWPHRIITIGRTFRAEQVVAVGAAYARGLRHESISGQKLRPR